MTALEYQKKFNKAFATAVKLNNVRQSSKRLLAMIDTLNRMRANEGIDKLILPNLEQYRNSNRNEK